MTVNRTRCLLPLTALLPTACASPGDVRAEHDRIVQSARDDVREAQETIRTENVRFPGDLATAEDWNHHWLGIPAAGWVTISIFTAIGLTIALVVWLVLASDARKLRRRREHELALERDRTERQRLKVLDEQVRRGNCQVCGGVPVPDEVIEDVKRRVE